MGAVTLDDPAGRLTLLAVLHAGGVAEARLASTRRVDVCRSMVGRPATDVPAAFARLYALCGQAHRIAARFALAAAQDQPVGASGRQQAMRVLAAERLTEHLRSTFLGFAGSGDITTMPDELASLRTALALAGTLTESWASPLAESLVDRLGESAADPLADSLVDPLGDPLATEARATGRLGAALAALGLDRARPQAGAWAGRVLDAVSEAPAIDCDALAPDDDAAVLTALAQGSTAFAQAPFLAGRRPETGAFARRHPGCRGGPRARLAARLAEIAEAGDPAAPPFPPIASGTLGPRIGFAALESPRGRVYHLASVDPCGRIARYTVLAPTEWNFAPDGPFMRALAGLQVARGKTAEASIRRLVALFDPCVACDIMVREDAHA